MHDIYSSTVTPQILQVYTNILNNEYYHTELVK